MERFGRFWSSGADRKPKAIRAKMIKLGVLAPARTVPSAFETPARGHWTRSNEVAHWLKAHRMLMLMWLVLGVLPLVLQARSYAKFAMPHQTPETVVVRPDQQKRTANLTELCPVQAYVLAGIWWNLTPTHYYQAEQGLVCHGVVPQYNLHGNYFIGSAKATPSYSTPSNCANDSFPYTMYMYHGSIGFYSFYETVVGTYCATNNFTYVSAEALGTYDTNGVFLANDTGSSKPRLSYWYATVGAIWLTYRVLMIRRSFASCRRYGRRCDELDEPLGQQRAMVFVQESLRTARPTIIAQLFCI
jgi:hypothetical protein